MVAAFVCTEVLDSLRITPKELANNGQTAMQAVFDNFKGITTWSKHFDSATKEQKDRYRMWSKGKNGELPDIEGIGAIGDLWSNERDWGVIKARLVTAHIWDYFFYRSGLCDLTIIGTMDIEQLDDPIRYSDQDEIQKIGRLSELHLGSSSVVTKAIKRGVLPHSANIPNGLRVSVEYAMENGLGRCVVCTSTLAQGVNLPIKYLVVSGVFQGEKLISTRDFHNLMGRAGRAGKHTEGSIIFADTELFDGRLGSKRRQWAQMNNLLDPSQSESCLSSLLTLVQPFVDDPFNIGPIKQIQSPEKYERLSIQAAERQGIDITGLLRQMQQRVGYIESLESYLLTNLVSDEMLDGEALIELCYGTFAYNLASDTEKEKLVQVFKMVAERVKQIEVEKRPCFGKALLGINELQFLEGWLVDNIEALDEDSDV